MSDTLTTDPASLAAEYLELMAKAEEYEQRARIVKDSLVGILPYAEGFKAAYGSAFVLWAKGRQSEKVDTKLLRKNLVLAGVTPEIIDAAFEQATTVSVGQPTMRIAVADQPVEGA